MIICVIQKHLAGVTRPSTMVLMLAALAGCDSRWPDIDATPTAAARAAPEPELLTGQDIAAALGPGGRAAPEIEAETLADRAKALKARAERLDGAVLPPSDAQALRQAACVQQADPIDCPPTQ